MKSKAANTPSIDIRSARTAEDATIQSYLSGDTVSPDILEMAFLRNRNLHDETLRAIVQHPRCPEKPLLAASHYRPDWLVDSPALAVRQLKDMAGKRRDASWKLTAQEFSEQPADGRLFALYSLKNDRWSWFALDHCLPFILDDYVAMPDLHALKRVANRRSLRCQLAIAKHKNLHARIALAKNAHLLNEPASMLARDRAVSVKTALASNTGLETSVYKTLAANKSAKLVEALLHNDAVPPDVRQALTATSRQQARADLSDIVVTDDVNSALDILRMSSTDTKALNLLVEHPAGLVRFAVAAHPCADKKIHQRILAATDVTDWVAAPVARRTTDKRLIQRFSDVKDEYTLLELAQNPRLQLGTSIKVIRACESVSVRTFLADRFLDDRDVRRAILETRPATSEWEQSFEQALDPATSSSQLLKIHRDLAHLYRCISRLIARHKNCPKALLKHFSRYLPEDAINLADASAEEKARRQETAGEWRTSLDPWTPEYLAEHYITSDSPKMINGAVKSKYLNPRHFARLAMLDNHVVEKSLLHRSNPATRELLPLPRIVHEFLSCSPRASARKSIALRKDANEEILRRLCTDSDAAVASAARENLLERGAAVDMPKSVPTTASLGNRRSRTDFARNTADPEVLRVLAKDPILDVRRVLAQRIKNDRYRRRAARSLPNDVIAILASDAEREIYRIALPLVDTTTLTPAEHESFNAALLRILSSEKACNDYHFYTAATLAGDVALIESLYLEQWKHTYGLPELTKIVLDRTTSRAIVDTMLERIEGFPGVADFEVMLNHDRLTEDDKSYMRQLGDDYQINYRDKGKEWIPPNKRKQPKLEGDKAILRRKT